jgi:molybdopterin-dependent oxidoreductase alpha subunit
VSSPASDPPPAGGWGSLKAVAGALLRDRPAPIVLEVLRVQNKPAGFSCVSCAWAKPAHPHAAEFCENGAKATVWELDRERAGADFFAAHTLTELRSWSDLALEKTGRLTVPLRHDAATDRYLETTWEEAFAGMGAELRALAPEATVYYTSGRASLETSYLWQLLARLHGTNNLPDSSNMCHESTSVALPETLGVPIGTVALHDFAKADAIFFFGQNVGVSSPRLLHDLRAARKRGVPIVTFNPLRESGLVAFDDPQSPVDMLVPGSPIVSTQYLQVAPGGDIAALAGLCKTVLDLGAVDRAFVDAHTSGFDAFEAAIRAVDWADVERISGLSRADLEEAGRTYARASRVIGVYGMGLTQHREGVLNVRMLSNLLLMRGNVGKPGAGICPVRGHSNVQGQRTVGITEKPELAPLDALAAQYAFEPPRARGRATVETCEGVLDGSVHAFLGLGGNFLRAIPDSPRVEAAWSSLRLTVQVATKLNRSHLFAGRAAWLLPCLGRIEIDRQASGPQTVSTEDSTGFMHASRGVAEPAAPTLRSEVAIVAGLAQAAFPERGRVPWAAWTDDYARIRDAIAATFPEIFHDFNAKIVTPGGFPRPNAAQQRVWKTPSGKATFVVPHTLDAAPVRPTRDGDMLLLVTLRSDDQFNTTVYSLDDRFRRVKGTRRVLFLHPEDLARLGLAEGQPASIETVWHDGVERRLDGFLPRAYDVPRGTVGGYFPELNPLVPLDHRASGSHVPAFKSVPVRVRPSPTFVPGDPA